MLLSLAFDNVMENFSPTLFMQLAGEFRPRPGIAVYLEEFKPDGGTKWDLDRAADMST